VILSTGLADESEMHESGSNNSKTAYLLAEECMAAQKYNEAISAYHKSFEYIETEAHGQLNNVTPDMIYNGITKCYTLMGDFCSAFTWMQKISTDTPINEGDIFAIFANHVKENSPQDLSKIYIFASENYSPGSVEYDNALTILESNNTRPEIKAIVAKTLENHTDLGDGYIHLQRLRRFYFSGKRGDVAKARESLAFFANSSLIHKDYGDIILAVIKLKADIVTFAEKFNISNMSDFTALLVFSNEDISDILLEYLGQNPLAESCNKPKTLRMISDILTYLMSTAPDITNTHAVEKYVKLFEFCYRIKDRYLRLIYKEEFYRASEVVNLYKQDAFVFYVAQAYMLKDVGDIGGYVRNLRLALQALPAEKDTINILFEHLKQNYL
jgi:tetratricopeptide (TPR) repeat protein